MVSVTQQTTDRFAETQPYLYFFHNATFSAILTSCQGKFNIMITGYLL